MRDQVLGLIRKALAVAFLGLLPLAAQTAGRVAPLELYRELRTVGLDAERVHRVRDVTLDRSAVHITFIDGTIAFTRAVDGHVTGAFFEGEGEVLLSPPNQVERSTLAFYTGAAILEEHFSTTYLRFNDNTYEQLLPQLRAAENGAEFVGRFDAMARTLADTDSLRLLETFTATQPGPPLLHARIGGIHLGTFDVNYDAQLAESVWVGQIARNQQAVFYDIWTAFSTPATEKATDPIRISRYNIHATVKPPHELQVDAEFDVEGGWRGRRVVFFELSRHLQLSRLLWRTAAGETPLEFLQNEPIEGTERARRGNDIVAAIFPEPLADGTKATLRFTYGGEVMTEAGGGLMYVGAKGIWYPNRGLDMSRYDMEFRYPSNWTLVASGKLVSEKTSGNETTAHWVADEPAPLAGFNLGQYDHATAKAGEVNIAAYAARGVENNFPGNRASAADIQVIQPPGSPQRIPPPHITLPPPPAIPSLHAQEVAQQTAKAVDWLAKRLGPFPYPALSLTQMPGRLSQGWPGLVYLSSYVYMSGDQRLRLSGIDAVVYSKVVPAHEAAHQWFGDAVGWRSYRDQWLMEALANYCALAMLERDDPSGFRSVLDDARSKLLKKHGDLEARAAGPVTLGVRLSSSKIPFAYDDVVYGRGTWLFHMLRSMMRDTSGAEPIPRGRTSRPLAGDTEEPFFQALKKLIAEHRRDRITNADVQKAMEAALPRAARYEGHASLDWFFEGWVDGTALPKFELDSVKLAPRGEGVAASGKIVQKDAARNLVTSVPIYAVTTAAKPVYLGRVFADEDETSFRFTAPAGTKKLLLDPNFTVLRRE